MHQTFSYLKSMVSELRRSARLRNKISSGFPPPDDGEENWDGLPDDESDGSLGSGDITMDEDDSLEDEEGVGHDEEDDEEDDDDEDDDDEDEDEDEEDDEDEENEEDDMEIPDSQQHMMVAFLPLQPLLNAYGPAGPEAQAPPRRRDTDAEYISRQRELEAYQKQFVQSTDDPGRQILMLNMPLPTKAFLMRRWEQMGRKGSSEYEKFHPWLTSVLRLPWNRSIPMPVSISDGPVAIRGYLQSIRQKMDDVVLGNSEAKDEIVDYVSRLISNPSARGSVLALW